MSAVYVVEAVVQPRDVFVCAYLIHCTYAKSTCNAMNMCE